jgi:hypothetical protein
MCVKDLPASDKTLVLRTDFSSDSGWDAVCVAVRKPFGDEILSDVEFVSDPEYDGLTVAQLLALAPPDEERTFTFIVDGPTISRPDNAILVVDLYEERGRTFRTVPAELFAIHANLSLANMDFADFAQDVNPDGVYTGL